MIRPGTRIRSLGFALGTLGALTLSGCGYALVGRGVTQDPTIKRVGVPIFKDRSGGHTLDQMITRKVIEELLRRGKFEVVTSDEGVDAIVDGEILSSVASPVGFSSTGAGVAGSQANRYAVTITAKVVYRKPGQIEPVWSNDSFIFRDEYGMTDNPTTFFDREDESLERLATAFSRSLVAAMLEAF